MPTTIQVHENVKNELAGFKQARESYEMVIVRLIKGAQEQSQSSAILKEGYKTMAKDSAKIVANWAPTEEWDF